MKWNIPVFCQVGHLVHVEKQFSYKSGGLGLCVFVYDAPGHVFHFEQCLCPVYPAAKTTPSHMIERAPALLHILSAV